MQITFLIYLRGGVIWDETLPEKPPLPVQLFEGIPDLEGALRITGGEGPAFEVEDVLPALIGNLCFAISRELQQAGHATYGFHSYYGDLAIFKAGSRLSFRPDERLQIPAVSYNAQAFTAALHDCGCRFLELLYRIRDESHSQSDPLNSLIGFLEGRKV